MATLALLTWLALRSSRYRLAPSARSRDRALRPWARLALVVVAAQIALGGWVSSNYAALACSDFPTVPRRVDAGDGFRATHFRSCASSA